MNEEKVWYVVYIGGPRLLIKEFIKYFEIMETERQSDLLLRSYRAECIKPQAMTFCSAYQTNRSTDSH